MGFWLFMLVMDLLIPVTMIGFGKYFLKGGPKEINMMFGYRTNMSMKNADTWEFAHRYCGRLWFWWGIGSLILTVVVLLVVAGRGEDVISRAGGVVCGVQLVLLIGTILPTEIALRRHFDKDGKPV